MRKQQRLEQYLKTPIQPGQRNQALFTAACIAAELGREDLLHAALEKAVQTDGLPASEAIRTVQSARRRVQNSGNWGKLLDDYVAGLTDGGKATVVSKDPKHGWRHWHLDQQQLAQHIQRGPSGDWYVLVNPTDGMGRGDANIANYAYTLVESDTEPLDRQAELFDRIKPCVFALVFSGNKSLHLLVKLGASDRADYDAKVARLHAWLDEQGYAFDKACKNPSRLTRLAEAYREGSEAKQTLLYCNKDCVTFEQFLDGNTANVATPVKARHIQPRQRNVIVEDTLFEGERLLLAGPVKIGKTLSTYTLAACLNHGGLWFRRNVHKPQRNGVLYVNLETTPEHVYYTQQHLLTEQYDLSDVDFLFARGLWQAWPQAIHDICAILDGRPDVGSLIIDPLYMLLGGLENDTEAVEALLKSLDAVIERYSLTLVITHHFRKAVQTAGGPVTDQASGSGFFTRWCDTAFLMNWAPKPKNKQCNDNVIVTEAVCRSFSGWREQWYLRWPAYVPATNNEGSTYACDSFERPATNGQDYTDGDLVELTAQMYNEW